MCERKEKVRWGDMLFREKIRSVISNITVEPILLCYVTPLALGALAIQNLMLEKACRVKLGYSDEVCSALANRQTQNYTLEEIAVQQSVATIFMYKSFFHLVPGIVITFLGSWSDRRRRRKPIMLLTFVGEFLCAICGMLCFYFFYEISLEMTVFLDAVFPTLFGGFMTFSMSVFSYVGDITTEESRTFRIGLVNIFHAAGYPLGSALSGVSYKAIGLYGVFGISAVAFVVGFIYCSFRIKDRNAIDIFKQKEPLEQENGQIQQSSSVSRKNYFCVIAKDVFDPSHFSETFRVVFKPRAKNLRLRLILLMVALHMIDGPAFGEGSLVYLYLRFRFNWDEVQFSFYATFIAIIHIFGTAITVGLLSRTFKFNDALIGVMSCMSRISAGILFAYARYEWQLFLVPILDILSAANSIVMKSIASKLVPPEELGKVYSIFGTSGSVIPLLYGPMFALLYSHTVDFWPGAAFVFGTVLVLPAAFIFWWLYQQSKSDLRVEQTIGGQAEPETGELTIF